MTAAGAIVPLLTGFCAPQSVLDVGCGAGAMLATFAAGYPGFHMTLSALEVALFRANLYDKGRGEFEHWGARQKSIQTDITIPFLPVAKHLKSWLAKVGKTGFEHYKVKVSGQVERDMTFVKQVRDELATSGLPFALRLDGNQGYSAKSYQQMLRKLEKARIAPECFEQPLRRDDWAGLRKLPKDVAVPLILDETVFSAEQCRQALDERICQGVNIKIAKSGIAESAKIHRAVRQAGAKLMIGCMTETMVGLSAGIHLAAGRGGFDFIDLDSVHLMSPGKAFGGVTVTGCRYHVAEEQ